MFTLGIDDKNDLHLNSIGNVDTKSDLDAILQNCQTAVQMTLNEALYRQGDGTPAFETIWSGNPNFAQAEASIRMIILRVDGVNNISAFSFTNINNIYNYTITIITNIGLGIVEGSLQQ